MVKSEPLLDVRNLGVRARGRVLLDQVSFTVGRGEVVAVIGPNGAGKTTLLEAVLGVRAHHAGDVRVAGRPLGNFRQGARTFAYLPDRSGLPSETTVRTLVADAISRTTGIVDVSVLQKALQVDGLLHRTAGALSRGEAQRVALFGVLALGRPLAVLDEPFAPFDPVQLMDVLAAVRGVVAAGTSVLTTVHQLADAEKIADRALLLAEGRSVAFDTLAGIRARAGHAPTLEHAFVALLSTRARHAP